jgi:hypothetical protein
VFAPGLQLTSSFIGGTTLTRADGGTSSASPHAAGCAALLIESGEALTPDAIETRLETSQFTVTEPENGLTFPRVDCSYSAIAALGGLIDRMGTLGFRGNSVNAYLVILNGALASLEAGNVQLALTQLAAFQAKVHQQTGKQLTSANAALLLQAAARIMAGAQLGYL